MLNEGHHNVQEHSPVVSEQTPLSLHMFKRYVSYLKVFFDPFGGKAFRDDNHPSLDAETQCDLRLGLIVLFPQ